MILVTGATGHVGNVLVRELLARGERVRALVLPGEPRDSLDGLDVELVEGDVLDPPSLERAMQGVQVVYHLAGVISIFSAPDPLMERVNIEGVRNVARAALRAGVRRMVHASSIHAFERLPDGVVVDESVPLVLERAAGHYDRTKAEGTRALLQVVGEGLDAVIVCPTGVIGPYDYLGSEMGNAIEGFMRRRLELLVNGAYDFVDVRDVANGLILACERGRTGELYILSGARVRLPALRDLVQHIAGVRAPRLVLPINLAMIFARAAEWFYRTAHRVPKFTYYSLRTVRDNSLFSCAKAERELGYRPRSLYETLVDTIRWLQGRRNRLGARS